MSDDEEGLLRLAGFTNIHSVKSVSYLLPPGDDPAELGERLLAIGFALIEFRRDFDLGQSPPRVRSEIEIAPLDTGTPNWAALQVLLAQLGVETR